MPGPDLSTTPGSGAAYELTVPTECLGRSIAHRRDLRRLGLTRRTSTQTVRTSRSTDPPGNFVAYETSTPSLSGGAALRSLRRRAPTRRRPTAPPSRCRARRPSRVTCRTTSASSGTTPGDQPAVSTSNNIVTSPGQPTVTTNQEQVTSSVAVDGQTSRAVPGLHGRPEQRRHLGQSTGPSRQRQRSSSPLRSPAAGVSVLVAQRQAESPRSGRPLVRAHSHRRTRRRCHAAGLDGRRQ